MGSGTGQKTGIGGRVMNGNDYGFFIWGSYLVTAVLMVAEILLIRRRRQKLQRRIERIGRIEARDNVRS